MYKAINSIVDYCVKIESDIMKLEELRCESKNIILDDYYKLYNYVRNNMENPEWLGYIPKKETIEILKNNGKIWIYYDNEIPVCSTFYIPSNKKTLIKHNININEKEVGALGPIMVKKEYVGNGLMNQMLKKFEEYNLSIGNRFIFTKVAKDNIFSVRNIEKNNYILKNEYINKRGINLVFLKEL